jgi:hypothetical protein
VLAVLATDCPAQLRIKTFCLLIQPRLVAVANFGEMTQLNVNATSCAARLLRYKLIFVATVWICDYHYRCFGRVSMDGWF